MMVSKMSFRFVHSCTALDGSTSTATYGDYAGCIACSVQELGSEIDRLKAQNEIMKAQRTEQISENQLLKAENEKLRKLARAVLSAERKMDKRHDDVIASWPSLLCMAREVLGERKRG